MRPLALSMPRRRVEPWARCRAAHRRRPPHTGGHTEENAMGSDHDAGRVLVRQVLHEDVPRIDHTATLSDAAAAFAD